MVTLFHSLKNVSLVALVGAGLAATAWSQTTVAVTGGDAGQGLTLDPSHVVRAYNLYEGGDTFTVQGVTFTNEAAYIDVTGSDPFAGDQLSSNDAALRSILQTMAWSDPQITISFSGLLASTSYRLDVLYYSGEYAGRDQAISVNGNFIANVSVSETTAYNTYFVAESDESGDINLVVSAVTADQGVVLNAVVLSTVAAAVPEPSTYAALAGVGALGLVLWRRRSRPLPRG